MGYWSEVDVMMQEKAATASVTFVVLPWWLEGADPFGPILMGLTLA